MYWRFTGAMVVAGGVGIGKNVNICGTLTVAGESTFNSKINVNGNIDIRDDDKILLGDDDDFEIYHMDQELKVIPISKIIMPMVVQFS